MIHKCTAFIVLAFVASHAFTAEIDIPDLESRIRNTGNTIPEAALPPLKDPFPPAVPELSSPVVDDSLKTTSPEVILEVADAGTPSVVSDEPSSVFRPVRGHAELGGGYPDFFFGSLFVVTEKGLHTGNTGASFEFIRSSSESWGRTSAGDGFFDRKLSLEASLSGSSTTTTNFWDLESSVISDSDGFQGKNNRYWSLSSRQVSVNLGYSSRPAEIDGFSWGAGIAGASRTVGPDDLVSDVDSDPADFISDVNSWQMQPRLHFTWAGDLIGGHAGIDFSGGYAYEGMTDIGEYHEGQGDLLLSWSTGSFNSTLSGGLRYDSYDGVIAPFGLSLVYDHPFGILSYVKVFGGLCADRVSVWDLATIEPFVRRNSLQFLASDWNAGGSLILSPVDRFSVSADMVWRMTAFARGRAFVTDNVETLGLVEHARVDRQSLESAFVAVWKPSIFTLEAGWTSEWMDRLWRDSLQSLSLAAGVSSSDTDPLWEAHLSALVYLDSTDIPVIGFLARLSPADMISFTVSVEDGLLPIVGKTRNRSSGYMARGGTLSLSARVDF